MLTGGKRSRFNLLLLQDGEMLFDEYIASLEERTLEPSSSRSRKAKKEFHGRVLLCSRGLYFEPEDIKIPVSKFPFRSIPAEPDAAPRVPTAFVFVATEAVRMKKNGVVGPYTVERFGSEPGRRGGAGSSDDTPGVTVTIRLEHSDVEDVLRLVSRLWKIAHKSIRAHSGVEKDLLQPIVYERHMGAFDLSLLSDFRERPLADTLLVERVRPLVTCPGRLFLTNQALYLQPVPLNNVGDSVSKWRLRDITDVLRRRRLLRPVGLELFLKDGSGVFLAFESRREREQLYGLLQDLLPEPVPSPDTAPSDLPVRGTEEWRTEAVWAKTRLWQQGAVSNYDYLMFLNSAADRTVNDLTQYPVFPWVIADYDSPVLDLDKASTFRDLSQPIGALNADRLQLFKARFQEMPRGNGFDPPFLYGTHYSTPGYVLYYLVRSMPEQMLHLQAGKFDAADRMFNSVGDTWKGVTSTNSDLKELIPEFFHGDGDFLVNHASLDLGVRADGRRVSDVRLPLWANNAFEFVEKNREALESPFVSERLHLWIDLIFGYKQQGEDAVKANNVFHHLTYEGAVDIDKERDPVKRASLQAQISEFGQTPRQVFKHPHPNRTGPVLPPAPPGANTADVDGDDVDGEEGVDRDGGVEAKAAAPAAEPAVAGAGDGFDADEDGQDLDDDMVSDDGEEAPVAAAAAGAGTSAMGSPPASPSWTKVDAEPEAPAVTSSGRARTEPTVPAFSENWAPVDLAAASPSDGALDHDGADYDWVVVEEFSAVRMHRDGISAVALSRDADARVLYSVSKDGILKLYDTVDNKQLRKAVLSTSPLSCCVVAPGGNGVLVGSWDKTLMFYSVTTGRVTQRLDAHADALSCMAADASGKTVLTGSWDASVKVWAVTEESVGETPVVVFNQHTNPVTTVAIHPDGTSALSASSTGVVVFYNVTSGSPVVTHEDLVPEAVLGDVTGGGASGVSSSAWVGASDTAAVCGADGRIALFSITSGLVGVITTGEVLRALCCDAAGECVVTAGSSGTVRFWDIRGVMAANHGADGRPIPRQACDAQVSKLPFVGAASVGGRLARGVSDMDADLQALMLGGHLSSWVVCAAAGANGTSLAAGGRSGSVKLWRQVRKPAGDDEE